MDLDTRRLLPSLLLVSTAALFALGGNDVKAADNRADALFNKGVESFQRGDLKEAVRYLEQAKAAGKDSVGLLYNLGVAHFRAGNLDAAAGYFRALLDYPDEQALAHYNLGLIALEQADTEAAVRHFRAADQAGADDRIRGLAREQLARLDAPVTAPSPAPGPGTLLAGLGAGHEDNLNLASDQTLQESSAFQDGFLWASQDVARSGNLNLRLTGLASFRQYNGASEADQQLARPGLALDYSQDDWQGTGMADSEWQWLDGKRLERRDRLRAEVSRRFDAGWIDAGGEIVNVAAGSRFPELDGRDIGLDLGVLWFWSDAWVADLEYRFTDEDREDLSRPGYFLSTSPRRHGVRAQARFYPESPWDFRASAFYEHSRYPDPEIREGVEQQRRQEDLWRFSSQARYSFGDGWRLTLDGEWETNSARLESRDYDRFEIRAGVEKQLSWE
ncbi:tetratricopeptide repeat protein [Halospina denitrificans]|uniref:Tetratricopeptide repeat protein n=1 Tax=Halospina denitrificans TaxID=332522 RepID=A0A4R7K3E0_9GAMM|nr:tetratricopeptide repeat protein [Halospina denitrificans]TDT44607.1 tetratricopeptide repeat protein [Halospina denitrificans]